MIPSHLDSNKNNHEKTVYQATRLHYGFMQMPRFHLKCLHLVRLHEDRLGQIEYDRTREQTCEPPEALRSKSDVKDKKITQDIGDK